jgi:lysyl-tRNA synthetase class 2
MDEALVEVAGIDKAVLADDDKIIALTREKGIQLNEQAGPGKAKTELFELLVEEKLIDPTFITSYPTEVSPLARRNEDDPTVTDRFELFITGRELANAFSELTDAEEQLRRFEETALKRAAIGDEVYPIDRQFIEALQSGMPPSGGIALGIDRLIMLLSDSQHISAVAPLRP